MADSEIEYKYTDSRRTQGSNAKPGTLEGANYRDVAAMRTRLAAINASLYTATYLNRMTKNDMVYAIRLADDAGGVK